MKISDANLRARRQLKASRFVVYVILIFLFYVFAAMGGLIAPGTDAGAWAVPHGSLTEFELLRQSIGENADAVLQRGIQSVKQKF